MCAHTSPLWERVARREAARRVRGVSPRAKLSQWIRGENPSSGASRHLLPQGAKEESHRRSFFSFGAGATLRGAALSWPLRRLGALSVRRARLLPAWTVVLTGLAVRPLRLLSGRRARPQLLLLRLERPRDARARGRIGAAEVALLGDDLPARG